MPPDCALLAQFAIAQRLPPPWEMQKPPLCAHFWHPSILQKWRPPCSMQSPLRRAAFGQLSRRHFVLGLVVDGLGDTRGVIVDEALCRCWVAAEVWWYALSELWP